MSTTIIAELAAILGVPADKVIAEVRFLASIRIPLRALCGQFASHEAETSARELNALAMLLQADIAQRKVLEERGAGTTSRYDWSQVPEGYDWVATDRCGVVYAYLNKPIIKNKFGFWVNLVSKCSRMLTIPIPHEECTDWRDSLEQRPA